METGIGFRWSTISFYGNGYEPPQFL